MPIDDAALIADPQPPLGGRAFDLTIERPLPVAKREEALLLRAALARNPGSIRLRSRLAAVLHIQDAFDEAVALLEPLVAEQPEFGTLHRLAECYLSRETADDDARAEAAAARALTAATNHFQRGAALAALGKARRRLGRIESARRTLLAALDAHPGSADAYKRLATIDLEAGDTRAVLDVADTLIARGIGHSRLLVARALALATLGRIEAAREAVGLERFLYSTILAPPPGWPTTAAFNAAVAAELHRHPDLRFNRFGTASAQTWRVDEPATDASVMIPLLQARIRDAVIDHVATLDADDTPWTRARPASAQLHNWCVMTDAEGYEEWHVHQHGWMSGVYYVDVPPVVAAGTGREGCIAFGLPETIVGDDVAAAYGERLVRPEPGMLMLFPSHSYHRTFPHGSDHRRICLAFDIQPR